MPYRFPVNGVGIDLGIVRQLAKAKRAKTEASDPSVDGEQYPVRCDRRVETVSGQMSLLAPVIGHGKPATASGYHITGLQRYICRAYPAGDWLSYDDVREARRSSQPVTSRMCECAVAMRKRWRCNNVPRKRPYLWRCNSLEWAISRDRIRPQAPTSKPLNINPAFPADCAGRQRVN